MNVPVAMASTCVVTCGAVTGLVAPSALGPAFLGMAAPLLVGLATIRLVEETARTDLERLAGRMTVAFVVKMVFYAVYVSIVIGALRVAPLPFAVSFTVYFVTLQLAGALYLRSLLTESRT